MEFLISVISRCIVLEKYATRALSMGAYIEYHKCYLFISLFILFLLVYLS